MISSGSFVELSREVFGGMLMRADLGLTEMALFQLVIKWGNHHLERQQIPTTKSNLREQVKDLLPLIRFPLMSVDELINEVKPYELLSDQVLAEEITAKVTRQRSPHFISAARGATNTAVTNATSATMLERLRARFFAEWGGLLVVLWFFWPCIPTWMVLCVMATASLPRVLPTFFIIRSLFGVAAPWRQFWVGHHRPPRSVDEWMTHIVRTPAGTLVRNRVIATIAFELLLWSLPWSWPVPSVIALVIWVVTNFVLNIGRPVPWVVMIAFWTMWYRSSARNVRQTIRNHWGKIILSICGASICEVVYQRYFGSPWLWLALGTAWHVLRHALRLVLVPGLTIKCAVEAFRASTRWNRHARRDAALGCIATMVAWGLVEAGVYYWDLQFPWTWPILYAVVWALKYTARLIPLPFFVGALREIFGQRARGLPCLAVGLGSTMAIECIYWMFNIQTPLLDPIQGVWRENISLPLLWFTIEASAHLVRVLPIIPLGLYTQGVFQYRSLKLGWTNMHRSDRKLCIALLIGMILVESGIRVTGWTTPHYGTAALNIARLLLQLAPVAFFALFKISVSAAIKRRWLIVSRVLLPIVIMTETWIQYNGYQTWLGSLIWTLVSYGIRTIPSIMVVQLLWHVFSYYRLGDLPTNEVCLVPRFTARSYAENVMSLFRNSLTTTSQQTPVWLNRWLITTIIPEIIAYLIPSLFHGGLQPFVLPVSTALHIIRLATWVYAYRGVLTSVSISSPNRVPSWKTDARFKKGIPALIVCELFFRLVLPYTSYRTYFGWFVHYIAFGWLRPYTACNWLTSSLWSCMLPSAPTTTLLLTNAITEATANAAAVTVSSPFVMDAMEAVASAFAANVTA